MEITTNTKETMRKLISEIKAADIAYFENDNPIISDREYDEKVIDLKQLETQFSFAFSDSPTQHVSGQPVKGLTVVEHTVPMLSCNKTKSVDELDKFCRQGVKEQIMLSWKEDGLTIVLRYRNGHLAQAITRGNGDEGEDVTHNIAAFKNVPLQIPTSENVEVRGECVMSWDDFQEINQASGNLYDHPRNLAAGTIRKLNPTEAAKRPLYFKAFSMIEPKIRNKEQQFTQLIAWGFDVVEHMILEPIEDRSYRMQVQPVIAYAVKMPFKNYIKGAFTSDHSLQFFVDAFDPQKYPFPVDGIVAEFTDTMFGDSLGATGHHKKCQMALKWADETARTHLRNVSFHVTRTGILSMVAEFDPVSLENSTVSKATLHNLRIFKTLKLGVGDELEVYKANKIIPAIATNHTQSNTFPIPMFCPNCGEPLVQKMIVNTESLICENPDCRKLSQLEYFCSKKAANIKGVSKAVLKILFDNKIIDLPTDLYTNLIPNRDTILAFPRIGEQRFDSLVQAVENSREMSFATFLVCLDIPAIGNTAAEAIAKKFPDIDSFAKALDDHFSFAEINGLGESSNRFIYEWFDDFQNVLFFNRLRFQVRFHQPENKNETQTGSLAGKNVVITGTLAGYTRADGYALIVQAGGIPGNSVTKNTDILVVATNPGQTKLDKAKKYGTQMMSEDEFFKIIF